MRLWSLHPRMLDRAALVACWREALLAQHVLAGLTRGYTKHPQLERFREASEPLDAISHFLGQLHAEATARGYRFDASKITVPDAVSPLILVTEGQLVYETEWLRSKVSQRAPEWLPNMGEPEVAPSFVRTPGPIASWERIAPPSA